jgi:hypothetical protein
MDQGFEIQHPSFIFVCILWLNYYHKWVWSGNNGCGLVIMGAKEPPFSFLKIRPCQGIVSRAAPSGKNTEGSSQPPVPCNLVLILSSRIWRSIYTWHIELMECYVYL